MELPRSYSQVQQRHGQYRTHLDCRQRLAGFGAALPKDATRRAALALIAEAHPALLWLLCDDQVRPWAGAW